jgi:hypothetical protein
MQFSAASCWSSASSGVMELDERTELIRRKAFWLTSVALFRVMSRVALRIQTLF